MLRPTGHQVKTNSGVTNDLETPDSTFYYFAYGSCMCPVDLKRSLQESAHAYVVGVGTLKGYRRGFYHHSRRRNCGVLDIIREPNSSVVGVVYRLPWRLSDRLDEREDVPSNGYRQEFVEIECEGRLYSPVRTYVVVEKLAEEIPPNDWYFNVVLRGAVTCGLPEHHCWQLFDHMHQLQQRYQPSQMLHSA